MNSQWNRGSEWHRWDPHIHTPSTLLSNSFRGDWNGYLQAIETARPMVEALGITDYCNIESYKSFLEHQAKGRALNVRFAFPNVEFRFDIQTERKRGINVHLLFSPEDPKHVREIERALGEFSFVYKKKYRCTVADLADLGRALDPNQADERAALAAGAEQFKLSFEELKQLFARDAWVRENCLVAVAASAVDGTAGLQNDSAFKALRSELQAFAHIIFSSQEGDRDFWLGRKVGYDRAAIEREYRSRKPCLHGSDAHAQTGVLEPINDRRCWIRANLSFMGLRQTLLEPESRVHIGAEPPPGPPPSHCLSRLVVSGAPWLKTPSVSLNDGLVAIIGPKGSGKTALADFIARAAGARIHDGASFLDKAKALLGGAEGVLEWSDNTIGQKTALARDDEDGSEAEVRYLSQQFVDRLCSAESMTGELLAEIEAVVFQAVPDGERLGTTTFAELRDVKLEEIAETRAEVLSRIQDLTDRIAAEEGKKAKLAMLEAGQKALKNQVEKAKTDLQSLLPKDKKNEVAELGQLRELHAKKDQETQALNLKQTRLVTLGEAYARLKGGIAREFEALKEKYGEAGLTKEDWGKLQPTLPTIESQVFSRVRVSLATQIGVLQSGDPQKPAVATDATTWPMSKLKERIERLTVAVGLEASRSKKHEEQQRALAELERQLTRANNNVDDAKQADARRGKMVQSRREAYSELFGLASREEEVLNGLYGPLKAQLAQDSAIGPRLEFEVKRHVDLRSWVAQGEALLDLRRQGAFQGRGRLEHVAQEQLLPAWEKGHAAEVAAAMDLFLKQHMKDLADSKAASVSLQDVGRWLFSAQHVSLIYGLRYDGLELRLLSPGMRGIVLLMLYLAIDQWDRRPLLVDQPEENLDPQSVYAELVGYFRSAKRRRQIILVTHNANLVVNADADQVIVAHAKRAGAGLPEFHYTSGGLEDKQTRDDVCLILEGGERAFREREQRYAFPPDPRALAVTAPPSPNGLA